MQSVHLCCKPCKTFRRRDRDIAFRILHIPCGLILYNIRPIRQVNNNILRFTPSALALTLAEGLYIEFIDISKWNVLNDCRTTGCGNVCVCRIGIIMATITYLPLGRSTIFIPTNINFILIACLDVPNGNIRHIRTLYNMFAAKDGITVIDIILVCHPCINGSVVVFAHPIIQCRQQISYGLTIEINRCKQREPYVCLDEGRRVTDNSGSYMANDTHRHLHTIAVGNSTTIRISHNTTIVTIRPLSETSCGITVSYNTLVRIAYQQTCPSCSRSIGIDKTVDDCSIIALSY